MVSFGSARVSFGRATVSSGGATVSFGGATVSSGEATVPGAKQARDEAKGATLAQNVTLAQGYAHIRAIRVMVRKTGAAADVQRAYSVGQKLTRRSVRDITAALQQIVDRAKANPKEAEGFGLLAADVSALEDAAAAVSKADAPAPAAPA